MFIKSLQVLGILIPLFLFIYSYFLFGDLAADTASSVISSMALWFMMVVFLAIGFVFFFVFPSSIVLSTGENRKYFCFQSKKWITVLVINWLFIGIYCVCALGFMYTSMR